MDKEEMLFHLSQIMKDVASGEYQPLPQGVPLTETEKEELKEHTLQAIQTAMKELAKDLKLPDGLKKALCLSEPDLGWIRRKENPYDVYEQIKDAVGELKVLDAIGIAKTMLIKSMNRSLKGDVKGVAETAVLLRLINSAMKEIDQDRLEPEERKMLSGNFIKSLEGVRWYLFGGDNQGEHK